MTKGRDLLGELAGSLPGAEHARSSFGDHPALYVDGREVAHLDAGGSVDIRLTRAEIRARRASLRADPRVRLRPSSSADWLEVIVSVTEDEELVGELLRIAVAALLPPDGCAARPAPQGRDSSVDALSTDDGGNIQQRGPADPAIPVP